VGSILSVAEIVTQQYCGVDVAMPGPRQTYPDQNSVAASSYETMIAKKNALPRKE